VNKRLVIFVVLLAAMLLSAVGPWPATLTVLNNTDDSVYIKLSQSGVMKYFLTATTDGNTDTTSKSVFDIERGTYTAVVTQCQTTTTWGKMNIKTNLRLNFTSCESQKQAGMLVYKHRWWKSAYGWDYNEILHYFAPRYWGEPTMEKPIFFYYGTDFEVSPTDTGWYGYLYYLDVFRFLYDVAQ
jgi:hypothetical protein